MPKDHYKSLRDKQAVRRSRQYDYEEQSRKRKEKRKGNRGTPMPDRSRVLTIEVKEPPGRHLGFKYSKGRRWISHVYTYQKPADWS